MKHLALSMLAAIVLSGCASDMDDLADKNSGDGTRHVASQPGATPGHMFQNWWFYGTNQTTREFKLDKDWTSSTESRGVEYYNPNKGTRRDYELDVDMNEGDVDRINFPNGGYLGSHDLVDQQDNGDGTVTITDDREYGYIFGWGGG